MFWLLLMITSKVTAQNCDSAPTEAKRLICQQIFRWDSNAKTVPVVSSAAVSAPGVADLEGGGVSALAASTSPTNVYECMDIACLCDFFGGTGGSNCVLPSGQPLRKVIRKEYRVMTDAERRRYHAAMWTIKGNGDYDNIARVHSQFRTSPSAHSGPAFLPWHREFCKRMEIALRRVDPTVAIPYWDSVLDEVLPNPQQSVLWGNELMGSPSADGSVRTGAFRNWPTVDGTRVFRRSLGTGMLLTESDISSVMNTRDFTQVLAFTAPQSGCPNPASWTALEYSHGGPHIYVGGDMFTITTSTNDPLFFNHHSFIDWIWEQWRQLRQSRADRERAYPRDNSLCSSMAHFGGNTMTPFFPMVNTDGLSNKYTDNLYGYAPRPTCSFQNLGGCGSKYLFCDVSHGTPRCSSKVRVGGNCRGYVRNEDVCYLGDCINGVCINAPTPTPTTQPPVVTTTPVGPTPETCYNEQQCCAPWAARGECSRNPVYMAQWCRASCGQCTPRTYNLRVECSNRHNRCTYWAQRGECANNPNWMLENCRQACGRCRRTREQSCIAGGQTTIAPRPTIQPPINDNACMNDHYCCAAWSYRGYCYSSSFGSYMQQYCRPACNTCGSVPVASMWNGPRCQNLHSQCPSWAARGECNANPTYMWENCKYSCNRCDLLNIRTRLSVCGLSRQSVHNRKPVSSSKIKSSQRNDGSPSPANRKNKYKKSKTLNKKLHNRKMQWRKAKGQRDRAEI